MKVSGAIYRLLEQIYFSCWVIWIELTYAKLEEPPSAWIEECTYQRLWRTWGTVWRPRPTSRGKKRGGSSGAGRQPHNIHRSWRSGQRLPGRWCRPPARPRPGGAGPYETVLCGILFNKQIYIQLNSYVSWLECKKIININWKSESLSLSSITKVFRDRKTKPVDSLVLCDAWVTDFQWCWWWLCYFITRKIILHFGMKWIILRNPVTFPTILSILD